MKKRKVLVRPWEVITCHYGHRMFICTRKITADDKDDFSKSGAPYLVPLQDIPAAWYSHCLVCFKKWKDADEFAAVYSMQEPIGIYVSGKLRAADYVWAYTEEVS